MLVHVCTRECAQDAGVHAVRELVHGQGVRGLYYDMYKSMQYLGSCCL